MQRRREEHRDERARVEEAWVEKPDQIAGNWEAHCLLYLLFFTRSGRMRNDGEALPADNTARPTTRESLRSKDLRI